MATLSETLYPKMPLRVRTTSPIQCNRTVHSIKKPAGSFIDVYPEKASLTLLTPGLVQVCLSKIRYHFHIFFILFFYCSGFCRTLK